MWHPLSRRQDAPPRFQDSSEPQDLTISTTVLILFIPSSEAPTTTWGVPAPYLRQRTPRAR